MFVMLGNGFIFVLCKSDLQPFAPGIVFYGVCVFRVAQKCLG